MPSYVMNLIIILIYIDPSTILINQQDTMVERSKLVLDLDYLKFKYRELDLYRT